MTLAEFEARLLEVLGRPTMSRPFVTEGSPLDCQLFFVGHNPATEMGGDWWSYWEPGYGFHKDAWLADYRRERMTRPLKPGRTRRNAVSATRRVLEWIEGAAVPAKCLETNIYSAATPTAAELPTEDKETRVLSFLLRAIRPAIIVAHGVPAVDQVGKLTGIQLAIGESHRGDVGGCATRLIGVPHFSRGWSRERAAAFGLELRPSTCIGDDF